VVLVGCGGDEPFHDGPASGSICRSSAACPGDQICRAGYCTIDDRSAIEVDARFSPPNSSSFLAQSIDNLTVGSEDPSLDVALEPSIVVSGEIAVDSDLGCVPGGELRFRRKNPPGTAAGGFQSTRTTIEPDSRTYEVTLLEGLYDIRFNPANEQCENEDPYPPFVWSNRRLTGAGADLESLPSSEALIPIQGQIEFSRVGGGVLNEPKPAQVFAVGSNDPTVRTTTDITDTSDTAARFEIWALPSDQPVRYDLVVGPSPQAPPTKAIATTRIESAELDTAGDSDGLVIQGSGAPVNLNPVEVGPYPSVDADTVDLTFEEPEQVDADGVDWTEFRVVIEARDLKAGRLVRRGHLVEDGTFTATAWPPSAYVGWIFPPPNARLRPSRFEFEVPTSGIEPVRLGMKTRVNGRVVDSRGDPLSGASVEATILADRTADIDVTRRLRSRRTATTRTDDEGRFSMWLEEANFRTVVQPKADAGLPRNVVRLATSEISGEADVEFRVPKPRLLRGQVFGKLFTSDGTRSEPIPKTRIEIQGARSQLHTTLARTRSRTEGFFSLLLPASGE